MITGLGLHLRFLNFLERQGAEIIVAKHSEGEYLEAKTASLISKRIWEDVVKAINKNPESQIDGLLALAISEKELWSGLKMVCIG